MKYLITAILLFVSFSVSAKEPIKIKVVTAEDRARLCPIPDCGQNKEILRIKTNSNLSATSTKTDIAHP